MYDETKLTISRELAISSKKLVILQDLKFVPRVLSQEEKEILDTMQRTNTGILALLLEHKYRQYNKKYPGIQYNPFYIDTDEDKVKFAEFLQNYPISEPFRFDFVIGGSGKHATPVSIIRDKDNKISIYSLDAAVFYDNFSYLHLIKDIINADKSFNYEEGGIQNSAYGCTIYSVQHLSAMSRMEKSELDEMFEKACSERSLPQFAFSPKIIRNMQSASLIEKYLNEIGDGFIVSKDKSFRQYYEENSFVLKEQENRDLKRNFAHTMKTDKFLRKAKEMIDSISEDEFYYILNKRSVKALLDRNLSVSPKGIDNLDILTKDTPNYWTQLLKNKVFDNILNNHQKTSVVSISDRVIASRNPSILEAVTVCGIDEERAVQARCFQDRFNRGIAVSFLKKIQSRTTTEKNKAVEALFGLIKDDDCDVNSEVNIKYKTVLGQSR